MTVYNSSSATSSYPLPNADNPLDVDVTRIVTTIQKIDVDMAARLLAASYTASDVLVKIKTVDGPGSGLDADTLDGHQGASFAFSTHTHADATTSASGFMTAAEKIKLSSIGNGANVVSVNGNAGVVSVTTDSIGAAAAAHAHSAATAGAAGFMAAADKSKLDGIGSGANVVSVNAKAGVVTLTPSDVGAAAASHAHANATAGAAGFMAAADKSKLDGISSATYALLNASYGYANQIVGLSLNSPIHQAPLNFFEIRGTGGAASLSFHRPNAFAAHFGIDSDNQWKVGGWSYGTASYRIWHEGNGGAGSGLDADTLDGQHAAAFAAVNHTHTGGQIPVVKSIQNVLVANASGAINVTISAVDPTKSVIVLSGLASVSGYHIALTSATNVQIATTQVTFAIRFQVVEFY